MFHILCCVISFCLFWLISTIIISHSFYLSLLSLLLLPPHCSQACTWALGALSQGLVTFILLNPTVITPSSTFSTSQTLFMITAIFVEHSPWLLALLESQLLSRSVFSWLSSFSGSPFIPSGLKDNLYVKDSKMCLHKLRLLKIPLYKYRIWGGGRS